MAALGGKKGGADAVAAATLLVLLLAAAFHLRPLHAADDEPAAVGPTPIEGGGAVGDTPSKSRAVASNCTHGPGQGGVCPVPTPH
jgi:hypothetical protein